MKNVEEVYKSWRIEKKHFVKESTFWAYVLLAENHIIPYFGFCTSVDDDHVQQFVLDKIDSGLSQKSIKDIIIVFKMIMKYGLKKKLIEYTVWDIQYPTNHVKKEIEIFNKIDHKKAIDYVKDNLTFRNLGILITLSTGLRIGEICALKWSDIDIENGVIHVSRTLQRIYMIDPDGKRRTVLLEDTPKTKTSNRQIPMSRSILNIMKPLKKIVNNDFYVLTNEAKPTEPRTYRQYYKEFSKKLGLPEINFHGLRHSFATRCIEGKADYKTVSVLMGHSNISTTLNLYVHPNDEQKKSVINSIFKGY